LVVRGQTCPDRTPAGNGTLPIYWARIERLFYAATRAGFDDAPICDELARPPAARQVAVANDLRPEVLVAFEGWLKLEDRLEY